MNVCDEFIAVFCHVYALVGTLLELENQIDLGEGGWTNYIRGALLY